jgi:NitT/TauT family transport system permease protein
MSALQPPPLSAEQGTPDSHTRRLVRILLPIVVLAAVIAIWELVVRLNDIPPYVLPGPAAVFQTLV